MLTLGAEREVVLDGEDAYGARYRQGPGMVYTIGTTVPKPVYAAAVWLWKRWHRLRGWTVEVHP